MLLLYEGQRYQQTDDAIPLHDIEFTVASWGNGGKRTHPHWSIPGRYEFGSRARDVQPQYGRSRFERSPAEPVSRGLPNLRRGSRLQFSG